eukprot:CAMPEP_0198309030 /NCGR_PEP_ID=MMETSP1450-20131203/1502_1 /TAXON_ID=753684 ORGANISM="Madagascaria erythrocladiodes, Strain CCMP3234" /NCGR_SAMPLE_ID=MMETSP1450 /ASSEMBLY_ACC=CAM_ASM_001115 /LENGTH=120 /DNA_ID=CAMNT_0044011751 /DNA_START=47 /DNA_END=406 /DNA_ORIENTATION=+
MDALVKQLKKQTGVVSRLAADLNADRAEVRECDERLARMQADGADAHDVKKQQEVRAEAVMMIPHSQRRLRAQFAELEALLAAADAHADADAIKQAPEYAKAVQTRDRCRPSDDDDGDGG